MKLIDDNLPDELMTRISRDLAAEELRGLRLENTQRSVLCYAWLSITATSIFAVLLIVGLVGLGIMKLPERVVLALIGGTVANASVYLLTIIRGLFARKN